MDRVALVVDDSHAAYEFLFRGVHSGSLYGEAPTGRPVTMPMVVSYQVHGGEITQARLDYDAGGLRGTLCAERIDEAGDQLLSSERTGVLS